MIIGNCGPEGVTNHRRESLKATGYVVVEYQSSFSRLQTGSQDHTRHPIDLPQTLRRRRRGQAAHLDWERRMAEELRGARTQRTGTPVPERSSTGTLADGDAEMRREQSRVLLAISQKGPNRALGKRGTRSIDSRG